MAEQAVPKFEDTEPIEDQPVEQPLQSEAQVPRFEDTQPIEIPLAEATLPEPTPTPGFEFSRSLNQQVITPQRAGQALISGVLSTPKAIADLTDVALPVKQVGGIQAPSGREVMAQAVQQVSPTVAEGVRFQAETPIEMGTEVLGGLVAEIPLLKFQHAQEAKALQEVNEALSNQARQYGEMLKNRFAPSKAGGAPVAELEARLVRPDLPIVDRQAAIEAKKVQEEIQKQTEKAEFWTNAAESMRQMGKDPQGAMQEAAKGQRNLLRMLKEHHAKTVDPRKVIVEDAQNYFKGTQFEGAPVLEQSVSSQNVIVPKSEIDELFQTQDVGGITKNLNWTIDPQRMAEHVDNYVPGGITQASVRKISESQQIAKDAGDSLINSMRKMELDLGINRKDKSRMLTLAKYAENRLDDAGIAAAKITDNERTWINQTKSHYDSLLTDINQQRLKYGLDPIKKRKDYITHLTSPEMREAMGLVEEPISLWERMGKGLKFKFSKARTADVGATNIAESFEGYVPSAMKQIHMTGPLAEMEARLPFLKPEAQKYFQEYIHKIKGGTNFLSRALYATLGRNVTDMLQGINTLATRSLMEGSINVAIQQPSQVIETLAQTGLKNSISGTFKAFSEIPPHLRQYAPAVAQRDLMSDITVNGSILGSFNKFWKATLGKSDIFFAKQTWFSAFENFKGQGYSEVASARLANDITRMLHADYREMMKAALSQGAAGRILQPMSTFAYNMWNHVTRDPRALAELKGNSTALRQFMTIVGSMAATNYIWNKAGLPEPHSIRVPEDLSPGEVFEAARATARIFPPEATRQFGGPAPMGLKAAGLTPDEFDKNISLGIQAVFHDDDEKRQEARDKLKKKPLGLVPGGRQISNILEGVEAVRNGYVTVGTEEVPLSTYDKILAPAIGPRALKPVRDERKRQAVEKINKGLGRE